jgi:hypothetical protein
MKKKMENEFPEIASYKNLISEGDPQQEEKTRAEKFRQFLQKSTKKQNVNQLKRFSLQNQSTNTTDDKDLYIKLMVNNKIFFFFSLIFKKIQSYEI